MIPITFSNEVARLQSLGWQCVWAEQKRMLPAHIRMRYPSIPLEYIEFVEALQTCENAGNTKWILSVDDFSGTGGNAYTWDEWERMSLEVADDDQESVQSIRRFWNQHLPIHFDVSDGYAFHALRVSDGAVVAGREPEFEEAKVAFSSFREFVASIC